MTNQNLNSEATDENATEAEQAKVSFALGADEKPDESLDSKKEDTPSSDVKTPDENEEKPEKKVEPNIAENLILARYKQQVEGSKQEALKEKSRADALAKENEALKNPDESLNPEDENPEVEQKLQPLEQRISSLEKNIIAEKEAEVNNIISTFRKENDISDEVYEVVIEPQLPAIKEMIDPATGKPYPLSKGLEIALIIGNREKLVADVTAETLAKVKAQKEAAKQPGAKSKQANQKEEFSNEQLHVAEQMGTKIE